jgi:hypothetical protein
MRAHRLVGLALISVAAARCSQPPRTLSFLPPVENLQAITIQDTVRSAQEVSRLFPIDARYELRRGSSGFVGPATFSVGSSAPRKAIANILLPFDAVRGFLQALAGLSIREGYDPITPPPGGAFPDVRIELKDQMRTVTIFTRSPGPNYMPWGVESDGRTYTIETNAPPKAFAALQPYLKHEVLESLTQAATSASGSSPR